jgi:hypothetical protein
VSGTVNNGGGGVGGGCKSTAGTGGGGGGGSGIVIIVVLNTTITNGSFNFNSTAITANSFLYVGTAGTAGTGQDSKLTTAGNQTFANIDLYFPCWSFFTRDANNNAILLTNGNSEIRVTPNDNNVQALNVQQYQNALLIASQSIQLSVGTYVLTYRAGPRYNYYFSTQKLSTSISSSQYGTIVLKNSESFVAGWTSFTHTIFIYTPGSYSINFTFENGSGSGTAIGTGTADGTSIALTDVNLTMTNQVPCFLQGSKILTFNPTTNFEEYVPIETLRKGDLIKTYSNGYKELAYIGRSILDNPSTNQDIKERLYRFSKSKIREMKEDLCITGRHCILHSKISDDLREQIVKHMGDVFVTENHYRVPAWLDDRSEPYNNTADETVTVWHLALENENIYHNYGVWANGLLVETCSILYLTQISDMELVV